MPGIADGYDKHTAMMAKGKKSMPKMKGKKGKVPMKYKGMKGGKMPMKGSALESYDRY